MTITLNSCTVELLYEKALFLPQQRLLVIADVHLGKAQHFRKEGIALPAQAQSADYERLERLFKKINPLEVYFLGDLFHSTLNKDWPLFCTLIRSFPGITFTLLKGNHDLIDPAYFEDLCIRIEDTIEEGYFIYSHEPLNTIPSHKINICGHIHPGILLRGSGRQRLKLPCFYGAGNRFILPAFGSLTGLYLVEQHRDAHIFGVLPESIRRINSVQ